MVSTPRPATLSHLSAVEAIVHEAYSPYIRRIGKPPGPMLDDYVALIEAGQVHVISEKGVVQGLIVLIPEPDVMLLDNVAVASAVRGKGVGRTLLQFAEQRARDAGYAAIRLYTQELMTENIALYTRIGYVETHRAEEIGLKRVFMTKRLF